MLTGFFAGEAIRLDSDGNTVAGNYIGTDGAAALEQHHRDQRNRVRQHHRRHIARRPERDRRQPVADRAGRFREGSGGPPDGTVIQGNYIGTDAAGSAGLSSGDYVGIDVVAAESTEILDNVLSGNGYYGAIVVENAIGQTTIQGNLVGLAADGTSPGAER